MKNIWILAVAGENNEAGDVIGMEETSGTTEAVTTADGSTGQSTDEGTGQPPQPQSFNPMSLLFMGIMFVMIYFVMFRGPKKKQQEHQKMISSLKKNDKIRTVGGIYGTIMDVRENEIILKIDESTNTKIKISPSAIGTVLTEETK